MWDRRENYFAHLYSADFLCVAGIKTSKELCRDLQEGEEVTETNNFSLVKHEWTNGI
jgi:hypothetical protein